MAHGIAGFRPLQVRMTPFHNKNDAIVDCGLLARISGSEVAAEAGAGRRTDGRETFICRSNRSEQYVAKRSSTDGARSTIPSRSE